MTERSPRKLRHWKERFRKDAAFIWARPIKWGGERVTPGDRVPQDLLDKPTKVRLFWEAKVIHLADFTAPNVATGQITPVPEPDEYFDEIMALAPEGVEVIVPTKGNWYEIVITELDYSFKVNGLPNLKDELLSMVAADKAAKAKNEETVK